MKIWEFSDLHQEHEKNKWIPENIPDCDLIIAAGDIDVPLTNSLLWLDKYFKGIKIIYVPGNHDFYLRDDNPDNKYTIFDQIDRGKELAYKLNINLLINDTIIIDNIRFIGATLWTDMHYNNPNIMNAISTARKGMNDYKLIRRKISGKHRHLKPEETITLHRETIKYFETVFSEKFYGNNIVITHHSPTSKSIEENKKFENLNWCYVSELDELIQKWEPDFWFHGHLHHKNDFYIGKTRIYSNPRGHWLENKTRQNFNQHLLINLNDKFGLKL